jgi:hypothetical protein
MRQRPTGGSITPRRCWLGSGPVTVKLERWGTLTGRLIGEDGRPRAGVGMSSDRPNHERFIERDGRPASHLRSQVQHHRVRPAPRARLDADNPPG